MNDLPLDSPASADREATPANKLLRHAEPLLMAVMVFFLLYQFVVSHVEGDQAYLLYTANRVIGGAQLDGPEVIETNPPFIVWFNMIPAGIAHVLHVDPVLVLRLVVLLMIVGSAWWMLRILRRSSAAALLGASGVRLLWLAICAVIVAIQPAEFGQREQLVLMLLLPYALATVLRVVDALGTGERIALGVAAGLAACFKPHHLLTLVTLELFLAIERKTLRRLLSPELIASVATGVAYAVAVRFVTPVYYAVIVPLLNSTYWGLGQYTLVQMVVHAALRWTLALVVLCAVWLWLRRRFALPEVSGALLAMAAGALLAFDLQHTGWYHQGYPATALMEIAAAWMIVDVLRRVEFRRVRSVETAALLTLAAAACALAGVRAHRLAARSVSMTSELAKVPEGSTVYGFSVGLNAFPVVLDHHLQWGSRFAHLWMLPAIRLNEVPVVTPGHPLVKLPPQRVAELADIQRRETTEDLARTQPSVIFVERCDSAHPCDAYTSPFDAVAWFSQDADFARIWSEYRLDHSIRGYDFYVRH